MSWLMVAKILPPFFNGDPPQAGQSVHNLPVGWTIEMLGKPCGVSVSQSIPGAAGTVEVHSRVMLERVPLPEVVPAWMQRLFENLGDIRLDLRNRAAFDTLGELSTFETRIRSNDEDPVVKMTGRVRNGVLRLQMKTGHYVRQSEHPWKGKSLLGGELSPEPKLLRVYVGRRWKEEVFSPFRPPGSPSELVEAEVVEEEMIHHDEQLVRTKKIVYRSLAMAGVSEADRRRAVLWVRDDGHVIRQDLYFMNVRLRFIRMSDEKSQQLADEVLELHRYATTVRPENPMRAERQRPSAPSPLPLGQ